MTMGGGMVGVVRGKSFIKQIIRSQRLTKRNKWGERLHRQNCVVRLIAGIVP